MGQCNTWHKQRIGLQLSISPGLGFRRSNFGGPPGGAAERFLKARLKLMKTELHHSLKNTPNNQICTCL